MCTEHGAANTQDGSGGKTLTVAGMFSATTGNLTIESAMTELTKGSEQILQFKLVYWDTSERPQICDHFKDSHHPSRLQEELTDS